MCKIRFCTHICKLVELASHFKSYKEEPRGGTKSPPPPPPACLVLILFPIRCGIKRNYLTVVIYRQFLFLYGFLWETLVLKFSDVNFLASHKGLVIINTLEWGGREYNFFSKKLTTHPNFPSDFHTSSENLPKLSYPNVYKLFMC